MKELRNEIKDWLAVLLSLAILLCLCFVITEAPIVALNVVISGLIALTARWACVRIYRRWFDDDAIEARKNSGRVARAALLLLAATMAGASFSQTYVGADQFNATQTTTYTNQPYNPSSGSFDNQLTGGYYYNGYRSGAAEWISNNIWLWAPVMNGFGKMFDGVRDPFAGMGGQRSMFGPKNQ